jgi:Geranylgeranyl pyrophosphate synthase
MNFETELKKKIEETNLILKEYMPEEKGLQKTIFKAFNYSLSVGGKRIRPILMQETFKIYSNDIEIIKPFMIAMEMIHTSSLVHDDLPCMDNDEYRRGKESVWKFFGEDIGTLAGDVLLIHAFEAATKALEKGADSKRFVKAIKTLTFNSGMYGMMGGQTVDLEFTGKSIKGEELEFIYKLKTAALIVASMEIGAIMGGADDEDIKTIKFIAENIGMAFQIRDDILDVISTTKELGKPILSDEKNNKTTYVTLFGERNADIKVEKLSTNALNVLKTLSGDYTFLENFIKMLADRKN